LIACIILGFVPGPDICSESEIYELRRAQKQDRGIEGVALWKLAIINIVFLTNGIISRKPGPISVGLQAELHREVKSSRYSTASAILMISRRYSMAVASETCIVTVCIQCLAPLLKSGTKVLRSRFIECLPIQPDKERGKSMLEAAVTTALLLFAFSLFLVTAAHSLFTNSMPSRASG
jgi:hypothetical protein